MTDPTHTDAHTTRSEALLACRGVSEADLPTLLALPAYEGTWHPAQDAVLGRWSDETVGQCLSTSAYTVARRRHALGIRSYLDQQRIDERARQRDRLQHELPPLDGVVDAIATYIVREDGRTSPTRARAAAVWLSELCSVPVSDALASTDQAMLSLVRHLQSALGPSTPDPSP